jgi:hypothetical protein
MLKRKIYTIVSSPPIWQNKHNRVYSNIIGNIWQDFKPRGFETPMSRKNLYEIF